MAGCALWAAVLVARLAMVRTGLPGVAVAAGSSLGRAVAGTVSRAWLAAAVARRRGARRRRRTARRRPVRRPSRLLAAAAAGLLAAEVLHRRATARLGGTTGDVMGAMGEVATTASLLAAAALWT